MLITSSCMYEPAECTSILAVRTPFPEPAHWRPIPRGASMEPVEVDYLPDFVQVWCCQPPGRDEKFKVTGEEWSEDEYTGMIIRRIFRWAPGKRRRR